MPLLQNFTGKKFGRLTVLRLHERSRRSTWDCICECGKKVVVMGSRLQQGWTKSCGCLRWDIVKITNSKDFSKVVYPNTLYLNTGISEQEYMSIHVWLRHHHGKPKYCEHCNSKEGSKYMWALKKGFKYERSIDNYMRLCPKCHLKYDFSKVKI